MKVFVFDLLAYGKQLDDLKVGAELHYPLRREHFDAAVAARTYAEHLDAWEEIDKLGYDGIGFNEHHCSPYVFSPRVWCSGLSLKCIGCSVQTLQMCS